VRMDSATYRQLCGSCLWRSASQVTAKRHLNAATNATISCGTK
jgi:hypothetical protein